MKRLLTHASKVINAKNKAVTQQQTQNLNANTSFFNNLPATSKKELQDMTARPIKNTYIEQNQGKAAKAHQKSRTVISRPKCPPVKVSFSQSKTQIKDIAQHITDKNLDENMPERKYPEVNKINSYILDVTTRNNISTNTTLASAARTRYGYGPFHDFLRGIEKNRCQTSREQLQLKAIKHPETLVLRPNKKI